MNKMSIICLGYLFNFPITLMGAFKLEPISPSSRLHKKIKTNFLFSVQTVIKCLRVPKFIWLPGL